MLKLATNKNKLAAKPALIDRLYPINATMRRRRIPVLPYK